MAAILTRRTIVSAVLAGGALAARPGILGAQSLKPGKAGYPIAIPLYMQQYIADRQGFFRDEGYEFQLVQGGSGVKMREILASNQVEFGIGDVTHSLQLSNRGRASKILVELDLRSSGVLFAIRKDLFDGGIDTVAKLAAWKRPDGRKPIFGVSSIGGTSHLWATYFVELMGHEEAFTWVGVGNVDTALGSIKSKQIDMLSISYSVIRDAEDHGWAKLIFNGSEEATWNRMVGGPVPVTGQFTLQQTIDKDPAKVQGFVNAIHRANQWIRTHSRDEIYGSIEPYVGSTSRDANLVEIDSYKETADWRGTIDEASYARGAKCWYREMTGLKPAPLATVYAEEFIRAALEKYPA